MMLSAFLMAALLGLQAEVPKRFTTWACYDLAEDEDGRLRRTNRGGLRLYREAANADRHMGRVGLVSSGLMWKAETFLSGLDLVWVWEREGVRYSVWMEPGGQAVYYTYKEGKSVPLYDYSCEKLPFETTGDGKPIER